MTDILDFDLKIVHGTGKCIHSYIKWFNIIKRYKMFLTIIFHLYYLCNVHLFSLLLEIMTIPIIFNNDDYNHKPAHDDINTNCDDCDDGYDDCDDDQNNCDEDKDDSNDAMMIMIMIILQ